LTRVIEQFGALGVFALMVPESACIPVPSELTLLFSGFAVSQHLMSFWLAVGAATGGNLLGSLLAYGVGASGLLARVPGIQRVMARYERTLGEHELRAVFLARLLPLARTFVSLPAGARRVPLGRFTVLTTAGCALWAALFVLAGELSGTAWSAVNSLLGKLLVGAGIALLAAWGLRRLHGRASGRSATRTRDASAAAVGDHQVGDHTDDETGAQHQQTEFPVTVAAHGVPHLADHVQDCAARR
jgi:membrane protein DedA with SNARE-associated domain